MIPSRDFRIGSVILCKYFRDVNTASYYFREYTNHTPTEKRFISTFSMPESMTEFLAGPIPCTMAEFRGERTDPSPAVPP
jgi:hypothetical protein